MRFKPNLTMIRRSPEGDSDAFHPERVQQDMLRVTNAPDFFTGCLDRLQIRFRNAGQRAVIEQWTELYDVADRLISARNNMERKKSDHLQLAREHDIKDAEKSANLAKLQADMEEHQLRREKAAYQRQHVERFVDGTPTGAAANPTASEHERRFQEANERRHFDARWELNESLRSLHTLIELQHWRRNQRDRILQDRSLSPEEQAEALQFVDELYRTKHAALKEDTRIFEEQ